MPSHVPQLCSGQLTNQHEATPNQASCNRRVVLNRASLTPDAWAVSHASYTSHTRHCRTHRSNGPIDSCHRVSAMFTPPCASPLREGLRGKSVPCSTKANGRSIKTSGETAQARPDADRWGERDGTAMDRPVEAGSTKVCLAPHYFVLNSCSRLSIVRT